MDKVKRKILQAAMNFGAMSAEKLQTLLAAICDGYDVRVPDSDAELRSLIAEIDEDAKKYDRCLKFVKHPLDGVEYLVFGLLMSNQACKYQPQLTDTERKFFFKLLETISSTEDYGIAWLDWYGVANLLPPNAKHPLTKQRVQDLKNIWVSQGYFLEKDDKIYFGPRMLLEFGSYLKQHFPEYIKDCKLCNEIVYWDITCSECNVKLHRACIRKYLIKKSKCPNCNQTWSTRLSQS